MRNIFVGLLLVAALFNAQAQKLYRCGNNFSQMPCGSADQKVIQARGGESSGSQSYGDRVQAMKAACIDWIRRVPAWKDRDSVKISDVSRGGAQVITIDDSPLVVVSYTAIVNGKNSYGGYGGEKLYVCYANEQETKIIKGVSLS